MPYYRDFYYELKGNASSSQRLIFLHGWGLDHKSLLPLAEYFARDFELLLIDQYGSHLSKAPDKAYDSFGYAELYAELLKTMPVKLNICIGHSYGARIIIQMATHFSALVDKAIFIAGAGLVKKRSLYFKGKAGLLKLLGRICTMLDQNFNTKLKLRFAHKFGSEDYRKAKGLMREILIKAVTEDLKPQLHLMLCPTLLIYGASDNITPVSFGKTFAAKIPNAKLYLIETVGHNDILTKALPQLQNLIEEFIQP
jgi:pimeloyl-ACP methyl ester carboxylesterase